MNPLCCIAPVSLEHAAADQLHQHPPRILAAAPPPSPPALQHDAAQAAVAGVMHKWVNYGKGWRLRWFVLEDGVLSYYKLRSGRGAIVAGTGEAATSPAAAAGAARVIGQGSVLRGARELADAAGKQWRPFGEIHLKVSSIRASKSDDKRLYIFSGTKTLHLRCESEEDKNAWIDALLAAKDRFPRSLTSNNLGPMADIMLSTEKLRVRLLQEGLSEAVVKECESIMMSELLELHNQIKSQQQQQSILIDRLRQLEREKVELERTVVHETKERETHGYANGRQSDFFSVLSGGCTSESEPDTASHVGEVETEEDEVTYFDTRDFLSAESLRSASCRRRELIAHGFCGSEYVGHSVTNPIKTTKYPFVLRRDKLPEPKEKEKPVGLWSIIKENIGKDLSGVCLPVYFNEPLSSLQKCFEDLEYSYLVDHALQWGEQNGRAERMIRSINNIIRSLLFQAAMPPSYWVEALSMSTHLLNLLPTKTLHLSTSHQSLFGSPPSYEHLRVFGCLCYPNTSSTAPHKLAPCSVRCVFLGFSPNHKGYRCLDLSSNRVLLSLHVVFDEDNFPFADRHEHAALLRNSTWDLVPRPQQANVVSSKWIFKHKFRADGFLERYKARWVLCGFTQCPGIGYAETFSPVVKPATVRTVLSLALSRQWPIHQLDVKNAFLHGTLTETVYCVQPSGFEDPTHPSYVSLRHVFRRGSDIVYLLVYVDDIVLTASSPALLRSTIAALQRDISMSDGSCSSFLGYACSAMHGQYMLDILAQAGMSECKPCITPVDTSSKLSGAEGALVQDATDFRSLAGALQYLIFTRPDIAYAVQQVCLHMHAPRESHLAALKSILRYIRGTLDLGLLLRPSASPDLVVYSDADWAGCPDTRKSTSGYAVFLGDSLVSWSSKRQATVSRSSAEAEYRAVANAVAEASWLRQLFMELHGPLRRSTLVYCDNISTVYMASNPVQHQRTKHIEIDLHFVWDRVALGEVRVLHVPRSLQFADIFTKGLPSPGDSLMRILYVAAFAVSGYASTEGRQCKPFNPLLGETYEADYPDKGLRFLSEKVSHHPMIVACHCDGRGWRFWGDSNLKGKFWGRSIQLDPKGVLTLEFDDGETFQWSKVTTSIYNIIIGKIYCDHYGTMRINGSGQYCCKLKFKEQSIIDCNPHQ
ncbi:hypothetical protein U9M48_036181, partial [Paspalum notatum var. saurae]